MVEVDDLGGVEAAGLLDDEDVLLRHLVGNYTFKQNLQIIPSIIT